MSTEQKVIEIIGEETCMETVKLEHRLREDLGADSFDITEISLRCEDEYEIELDAATVEAWVTVRDVVDAVTQRVGE